MTRGPSGSAVRSYIEPMLAEVTTEQTEAAGTLPSTGRSMTIRDYLMKVWIQGIAKYSTNDALTIHMSG